MAIVTLDEAKDQLGIEDDDSDDELTLWINGLASTVENYLHEAVTQRTVEQDVDLSGARRFWLKVSPVISLTSVVSIDGTVTYNVANLLARPSGRVRVIRGPLLTGCLTVTYEAGYETVPENYKRGALVILEHVWETQRGAAGVEAGVIGPEEVRRALSTFTVPNKAKEWLGEPTTLAG